MKQVSFSDDEFEVVKEAVEFLGEAGDHLSADEVVLLREISSRLRTGDNNG